MTAASDYPVRFEVAYPEGENRYMILLRWLGGVRSVLEKATA